jgi:hypothetical protein
VRIQGFTYLLLLRGLVQVRFGFHEEINRIQTRSGLHHFIQPLKGSDVEILSRAGRSPGLGKDGARAVQEATVPPVSEFGPSWAGAFGRDGAEPTARAESPVGEIFRDCRCFPVPHDS